MRHVRATAPRNTSAVRLPDALAAILLALRLWTCLTMRTAVGALPTGSDWPQYLGAARMTEGDTEPALLAVWPDWRTAVYPWLLGRVLAWKEQADATTVPGVHAAQAAHIVGVVGIAGVLLGGWALARALGGARAGVVTAALLATSTLLVPASAWLNPYPLLAGTVALALAAAAVGFGGDDLQGDGNWRRSVRRWAGALVGGLLAGVAWAVDPRGGVVVVAVAFAVVAGNADVHMRVTMGRGLPAPATPPARPLAAPSTGRGAIARAGTLVPGWMWMVGVLLVAIVAGRAVERACAPAGIVGAQVPFGEQVRRQLVLAREELAARGPAEVATACSGGGAAPGAASTGPRPRRSASNADREGGGPPSAPSFSASFTCARSLLPYNLSERNLDGELPAWPLLLLASVPLLAPVRVNARRVDGGGILSNRGGVTALLGIPTAALVGNAALGLLPDRYLLVFLAPLLAAMGVGATVVIDAVSARLRAGWVRDAVATGLVVVMLVVVACAGPPPRLRAGPSRNGAAARDWLHAHLHADDAAMDCAGLGLGALWLPARLHPAPYNLTGSDAHGCEAWVRAGAPDAGVRYVLTGSGGPRTAAGTGWRLVEVFAAETLPEEPPVTLWQAVPRPQ